MNNKNKYLELDKVLVLEQNDTHIQLKSSGKS